MQNMKLSVYNIPYTTFLKILTQLRSFNMSRFLHHILFSYLSCFSPILNKITNKKVDEIENSSRKTT